MCYQLRSISVVLNRKWAEQVLHRTCLSVRKDGLSSGLQRGHAVYCQTCRTVPNSPLEGLVLHRISDVTRSFRPFWNLTLNHLLLCVIFKASGDGRVASSSCVSSCLVSWCVCSCQYLCLLWIACFSPWLNTNVAHKLLLTLMWTKVGDPYEVIKGTK